MKRWDIEIGGIIFAALFVFGVIALGVSLVGHVMIAIGLLQG